MRTTISNQLIKAWEDQAVQILASNRDAAENGRVQRKDVLEALQNLRKMGSVITRAAFYKRVQRQTQRQKDNDKSTPPPVEEVAIREGDDSAGPSALTGDDQDDSDGDILPEPSQKKAGRPKGTTNDKKLEDLRNLEACINEVVRKFKAALDELKADPSRKQLKKGVLSNLIEETKVEYGVESDIKEPTIRKRVFRQSLYPRHCGSVSPVLEEEKVLVVIALQMARIRQPLNCQEGIKLMNDLIKDSPYLRMTWRGTSRSVFRR